MSAFEINVEHHAKQNAYSVTTRAARLDGADSINHRHFPYGKETGWNRVEALNEAFMFAEGIREGLRLVNALVGHNLAMSVRMRIAAQKYESERAKNPE